MLKKLVIKDAKKLSRTQVLRAVATNMAGVNFRPFDVYTLDNDAVFWFKILGEEV